MKEPLIPSNEPKRLAALRRYGILDTLPEQDYDEFVKLAAAICDTPIALISLVDQDRQWFKSRVGLDATETPRNISFCGHVVAESSTLMVPDATADDRFADNPLVLSDPKIRFYGGVPLMTHDHYVLGTLCVIDRQPKRLSAQQLQQLESLSRLIMSQLELRRSSQYAQFLADVVNFTDDAVITNTVEGIITSWNPAAANLLGYREAEAVGQSMSMLFPAEDLGQAGEQLRQGTAVNNFETVCVCRDGRLLDVSATLSLLRDEAGIVTGAAIILRDITEYKRVLQKLQGLTQQLQESNQELEQYAYVCSHDLQEPLRKITAFGDRLKASCQDGLDEKSQDYLERMLSAANRAQVLINDLLAFSRVTTKVQSFEPVDLSEILEGVLSDLEIRIEQTGATVEVDPLPIVMADSLQMRQLLQNLVGNALKFRQEGVAPIVQVRSQIYPHNGQDWCEIQVIDNGIGFEQKYADRIFLLFQRLHGRSSYEGTGIGLAICRKIVELHGGLLTVQSQPDQGATFRFNLPVHDAKAHDAKAESQA